MKLTLPVCLLLLLLVVLQPCLAQTRPQSRPQPIAVSRPTTTPATTAAQPAKPPAPPAPVIVGSVNGSPISQAHVDQAIGRRWAGLIMRAIIEDRLIRQEARRLGIKVSADEVQALFAAERAKYPSESAFQRHLRRQGLTTEGLVEQLTTEALLTRMLERQVAVSEAEIKAYYEANRGDYVKPAQVHLFAILTGSIEDAYLVRERLAAGDKFDVVAKELSQDAGSKEKGGDLGWLRASAVPFTGLADTIFAMEPGVVSSPLRTDSKYVIALVKERRPQETVPLSEAREHIASALRARKSLSAEEFVDALARKADISVTWPPASYLTAEYRRLRDIQVVVNDKPLDLPAAPVRLPNGTIIVPAKPVLQAVGARLTWKASDQSLLATSPLGQVKMVVGSPRALVGLAKPAAKDMRQAPQMRSGTLYIAPRVALEALGATLTWDAMRNRLVITTPEQNMPSPTVPKARTGLERQ